MKDDRRRATCVQSNLHSHKQCHGRCGFCMCHGVVCVSFAFYRQNRKFASFIRSVDQCCVYKHHRCVLLRPWIAWQCFLLDITAHAGICQLFGSQTVVCLIQFIIKQFHCCWSKVKSHDATDSL